MKIWITGAAGFLGGRLLQHFRSEGHEVTGLSRGACASVTRSIQMDLAADDAPRMICELVGKWGRPDVLVHAAARKPGPWSRADYVKSNVLGTANLLAGLEAGPPGQFIHTSTLTVYGRPDSNPVTEAQPARGTSAYAITKYCGEQLCEAFSARAPVAIFRLPSLYGGGQKDSFIDGLARLALAGETIEIYDRGKTVRDALHVDDVVAAMALCIARPPGARVCRMNLGCGRAITSESFARSLVEALKSRSPVVPVETASPQPFDLYADISEARRQIGFVPSSLQNSMKRYVHELQARP